MSAVRMHRAAWLVRPWLSVFPAIQVQNSMHINVLSNSTYTICTTVFLRYAYHH